jgi:hypothetical protein
LLGFHAGNPEHLLQGDHCAWTQPNSGLAKLGGGGMINRLRNNPRTTRSRRLAATASWIQRSTLGLEMSRRTFLCHLYDRRSIEHAQRSRPGEHEFQASCPVRNSHGGPTSRALFANFALATPKVAASSRDTHPSQGASESLPAMLAVPRLGKVPSSSNPVCWRHASSASPDP